MSARIPDHHDDQLGLDVYLADRKSVLSESPEFQKKGLQLSELLSVQRINLMPRRESMGVFQSNVMVEL